MDAPEPLPDRQRVGRVKRSSTVWERRAADAAAKEYASSPAAREINRLSKELAAVQQKFRAMRGEGGINVVGEGEIIRMVNPPGAAKANEAEVARTEVYVVAAGVVYTGELDVRNLSIVEDL